MAEREVKIRFSGDAKALKGVGNDVRTLFGNMTDDINDARGAGAKMGDALKQAAEKARTEMEQLDETVMVMADSLGPEMTAALGRSEKDIADYIAEWKRLGLTYDDIRAESDSLAAGLKELDGATRRSTDEVGAGLAKVGHEADQSRSVLANMVGNSAQDLGELAGVAGSAGVMLGQLAEYAADGNISIGGLAKTVGPMAAVGVAVAALSSVMAENAKQQQFLKDQTAAFSDALKSARTENKTTTQSIVDAWAQGGKIEAQISNATATLVEFGKATDDMGKIHDLRYPTAQKRVVDFAVEIDKLGMSAEDMARLAQQPIEKIQEWGAEMVRSGKDAGQVNLVMQGAAALHVRLAEAATTDAVNHRVFGDAIDDVAGSMDKARGPFSRLIKQTSDWVKEQQDAEQATRDANDALLAKIDTDFAAYDAQQNLIQAGQDLAEVKDDEATAVDEVDQAQKSYVKTAIEQAAAVANMAEQQAIANGQVMTAKEKQDKMITSLQMTAATLDPKSPVRKMLDEYIAALLRIPPDVTTAVKIIGKVSNTGKQGAGVTVTGTAAAGTDYARPGTYLVGEQGPELVRMQGGEQILPTGQTMAALGGGGDGTIVIVLQLGDTELQRITVRQRELAGGTR